MDDRTRTWERLYQAGTVSEVSVMGYRLCEYFEAAGDSGGFIEAVMATCDRLIQTTHDARMAEGGSSRQAVGWLTAIWSEERFLQYLEGGHMQELLRRRWGIHIGAARSEADYLGIQEHNDALHPHDREIVREFARINPHAAQRIAAAGAVGLGGMTAVVSVVRSRGNVNGDGGLEAFGIDVVNYEVAGDDDFLRQVARGLIQVGDVVLGVSPPEDEEG